MDHRWLSSAPQVNPTTCKRLFSLGCVAHTDGCVAGNLSWQFVFLLLFLGGVYSVGGAVLGARRKGEPLRKGPAMLRSHPHWGRWVGVHGLVMDGVNFARARIDQKRGKGGGGGGGGYQAVPSPPEGEGARDRGGGRRRISSKSAKAGRSKGSGGKGSRSSSKPKKTSKTKSDADGAAAGEEGTEGEELEASERLLQEQRDQTKHSSQQSITVVGLNAI